MTVAEVLANCLPHFCHSWCWQLCHTVMDMDCFRKYVHLISSFTYLHETHFFWTDLVELHTQHVKIADRLQSMTAEVRSSNVPFTVFYLLILFIEYNLKRYHDVTNGNIFWGQGGKWFCSVVERVGDSTHAWQSSVPINFFFPFPLSVYLLFLSFFLRSAPQCSSPIFLLSSMHIDSFGMKWCIQCYKKSVSPDDLLIPWNLRQDVYRSDNVVH